MLMIGSIPPLKVPSVVGDAPNNEPPTVICRKVSKPLNAIVFSVKLEWMPDGSSQPEVSPPLQRKLKTWSRRNRSTPIASPPLTPNELSKLAL